MLYFPSMLTYRWYGKPKYNSEHGRTQKGHRFEKRKMFKMSENDDEKYMGTVSLIYFFNPTII